MAEDMRGRNGDFSSKHRQNTYEGTYNTIRNGRKCVIQPR
jgi:hypothetical protein